MRLQPGRSWPTNWRTRTFTYSSLSQLLTASNPESGAISYTYDDDGNMVTKTHARNITTTHTYDALHRLTAKTYSNAVPAISYSYDQTSYNGLTIAKGIGRRTGMKVNNTKVSLAVAAILAATFVAALTIQTHTDPSRDHLIVKLLSLFALPGFIVEVLASMIVAGNFHDFSLRFALATAFLFNFFLYYKFLIFLGRVRKRTQSPS